MRWAGGSRALGAAHAREFSPSRSADNNLIAGRLSPNGLAYYTASETLARPGSRCFRHYQLSIHNHQPPTTNYQLSTFNFQLFICHALPCFIAIARFGGGNDLFASMMAFGTFYTASETLARPGSRCFRHYPLSTFNYSLAKLYLAFVSVARFGGGRGIRRLAARGWASLLIGADLPKGWPAALFMRRARRSRPQEAAALGTIHFQLSTFNYSLAKLYLAFVSVARFGGGRGIRRLAARGWASLLIGADLPKGRALARSLFTRRARRSRAQDAAALGTINYQFTTTNHQLSTIHFQLSIIHLPRFTLLYCNS